MPKTFTVTFGEDTRPALVNLAHVYDKANKKYLADLLAEYSASLDAQIQQAAALQTDLASLRESFDLFLQGAEGGESFVDVVKAISENKASIDSLAASSATREELAAIEERVGPIEQAASQTAPGLMSAADKKKLDGIAAGAQVNNTNVIPRTGARGTLAGSETAQALANSQAITSASSDCINLATSGAVKLTFTAADANVRAIKAICLTASAATTLTVGGAFWANNGDAPTWGNAGEILVLLAHFVGGRVVLSVADNTQ